MLMPVRDASIDLAHFLRTGGRPLFGPRQISWDPIFGSRPLTVEVIGHDAPSLESQVSVDSLVEPRLATCFRDLQHFTAAINAATPANRIPSTIFQETVCSIQNRLMALKYASSDFLAECLRLGMLAFLTTTYQLPGNAVRYPYLAEQFRMCYLAVEAKPELRDLIRWLLMIGAISVYGLDEPWLRDRWRTDMPERPGEWEVAKAQLRRVMWMDGLHDHSGKHAYNILSSPDW